MQFSRPSLFIIFTISAFASFLAPQGEAKVHKDKVVGFSINVPKDFINTTLAGHFRSKFCVASFKHKRGFPTGFGFSYYPEITCFLFPAQQKDAVTGKTSKPKERKNTGELDMNSLRKLFDVPYRNFEELAKDQIRGFFFDKPKEKQINGFPATAQQMVFEKLANIPQRWLVTYINVKGDQFAIVQTCTHAKYPKLKGKMNKVASSFKVLNTEKGLFLKAMKMPIEVVKEGALTAEEMKLPLELRNKVLVKKAEKILQKRIDELARGWTHKRTANYLLLSHVDKKFTNKIANQAEAIRSWLDTTFGNLGEGAIPPAIIRIYKDAKDRGPQAGLKVITQGALQEIVLLKRSEWGDPKEAQWDVTVEIIDKWFTYRNEDLWDRMPSWMTNGITRYLVSAQLKGKRLIFKADPAEKGWLNEAFITDKMAEKKGGQADAIKPLRKLVQMTRHEREKGSAMAYWAFRYQCGSFIRFLFDGPGKKMKQTKGIIQDYAKHLLAELVEVEKRVKKERSARNAADKAKEGMTDEEKLKAEDEEYKRRRKTAVDAGEKKMLENVFGETFGNLSDKEWKTLQKKWEKFAGK